jgi:hypothetical protein
VTLLESIISDYDWKCAFEFAGGDGDGTCGNAGGSKPELSAGSTCYVEPFGLPDVAEIFALDDGANDEENWVCCGVLKDGRFFFLEAGCDYTSWDCRSSGRAWVADSHDMMVRFAMSDDGRKRLLPKMEGAL